MDFWKSLTVEQQAAFEYAAQRDGLVDPATGLPTETGEQYAFRWLQGRAIHWANQLAADRNAKRLAKLADPNNAALAAQVDALPEAEAREG